MGSGAWRMTIVEEEEEEIRKGPWTLEEDTKLIAYVRLHGAARWSSLAKIAGLKRNGKSCRMRWLNYLCPELKHGTITPEEERLIIRLHNKWGNKWSRIAQNLPGRTDNEIKNHWRTHIKKISPELIRSCSWRRASKSPEQIMAVRENNEPSSSESFEDQQMASMMECCAESNSSNTLNQVGCDICELHDGYQASLTSPEMHQEFIEISSDMDTLSSIIVDAYEAGMGQHSPSSSWSSLTDSPMNVFSDSEEFLWDYNSIDLWKLDDDVQNMHW